MDFTENSVDDFVPETLMTAVLELEEAYRESQADPSFSRGN